MLKVISDIKRKEDVLILIVLRKVIGRREDVLVVFRLEMVIGVLRIYIKEGWVVGF